ncbi:MAG TPA: hypothetical protein VLH56_19310 [Dissulfurispiraceae bacterium]|nr:hypothetical protein [Dissulfurispiraceae bacterium]
MQTIQKEQAIMRTIHQCYPGHELVGIAQVFINHKGWVNVLCTTKQDAVDALYSIVNGSPLYPAIDAVNLRLRTPYDTYVEPDYPISEFKVYF